jgi:hypothetical protein
MLVSSSTSNLVRNVKHCYNIKYFLNVKIESLTIINQSIRKEEEKVVDTLEISMMGGLKICNNLRLNFLLSTS